MLRVEDLWVEVGGQQVLHEVNFHIPVGQTHILFGKNGSGKTSLLLTLIGYRDYRVVQGRIIFKGREITHLPIHERVRLGMGVSFQRPPTVRGLLTRQMVEICNRSGRDYLPLAERLNFVPFLDRELNVGFSGGEMKRSELLQLLVQQPDFVMLDEPESGVDIENMKLIGKITGELLERHLNRTRRRSGLIITHTGYILDYTNADLGYVMLDGTIVCTGNPFQIFATINEKGFEECAQCTI
ncbi:MAG: ABC transporter ATP-binding protein [Deltaproteobacteria bacterium]|nr:ABC transporter ATP-binding protein [Deltaproteobacteria bacterium]